MSDTLPRRRDVVAYVLARVINAVKIMPAGPLRYQMQERLNAVGMEIRRLEVLVPKRAVRT
jgi:hypothetical protein